MILLASFASEADAQSACERLSGHGISKSDMSMVVIQDHWRLFPVSRRNSLVQRGAGAALIGAVAMVLVACILAVLAWDMSMVLPGLGFLVRGSIVGGLVGAGAGAIIGMPLGFLAWPLFSRFRTQNNPIAVLGVVPRSDNERAVIESALTQNGVSCRLLN